MEPRASTSSQARRRMSATRKPKSRHLMEMSDSEKLAFLESFDVVITEIVGVIWWLDEDIPNAGKAIMLLKEHGKQVRFMSNYGGYTDEHFLRRMATIGITNVKKSDVACTCKTLTQYLRRFMGGQQVFSLCNDEMNKEFYKKGIDIVSLEPNTAVTLDEIVRHLCETDPVGAVVMDWNFNLTYAELAMAHHFLQRDGCAFIVGSTDMYGPVARKFKTIGPGLFMNMLRESSGKEPIIWGRPARVLCEELKTYFKLDDPKRVLFIGSDITIDIDFAISCGYQTCFVNTGTSTIKEIMMLPDNAQPDYVAGSIGEFVEVFKIFNKKTKPDDKARHSSDENLIPLSDDKSTEATEEKRVRLFDLKAPLVSEAKVVEDSDDNVPCYSKSRRLSTDNSTRVSGEKVPRYCKSAHISDDSFSS